MLRTLHEIEYWVYKKRRLLYSGRQKCNSYLKNWVNLLCAWFQSSTKSITLEDGSSVVLGKKTFDFNKWCNGGDNLWCSGGEGHVFFTLDLIAGDNDASFGLVVGRGTTPVSPDDYKLDTKYNQGSGTGYLDYDITKVSDVVSEDNKLKISVERAFYNNHSESQDITEVGLMARYWLKVYSNTQTRVNQVYKFLIMRDVLDNVLTIPAYATAVVRYNIYFLVG